MSEHRLAGLDPPEQAARSLWLIALGSSIVITGLALGLWAATVFYAMLFQPETVPLVQKVFALVGQGNELFELVKGPNESVKLTGVGLKYLLMLLLAIFLFNGIGGIVRAFLEAGVKVIRLGTGVVVAEDRPGSGSDRRKP